MTPDPFNPEPGKQTGAMIAKGRDYRDAAGVKLQSKPSMLYIASEISVADTLAGAAAVEERKSAAAPAKQEPVPVNMPAPAKIPVRQVVRPNAPVSPAYEGQGVAPPQGAPTRIQVVAKGAKETLDAIIAQGGQLTIRGLAGKSSISFKPVKKLGEGGCGVAYKATSPDLLMPSQVLKISLTQDPALKAALQQEINVTKDVRHKQINPLTLAGTCDETKTLVAVYPFINGLDVADYQEETRKQALFIPPILVGFLGMRLFQPLAYMARSRVAHQDVCDHNTMIDLSDGLLKILDFGMAKANLDQTGKALPLSMKDANGQTFAAVFGKPQYMSPAKFHSQLGVPFDFAKEDVYAACTLLYALALHTNPYPLDLATRFTLPGETKPAEKYSYSRYRNLKLTLSKYHSLRSPADIRPDIPDVLNDIIMDGLALTYDERGVPNLSKVPTAKQMYDRIIKYVFSEYWGLGCQDVTLTRYLDEVVKKGGANNAESVRNDLYLKPIAIANHYDDATGGPVNVTRTRHVGKRVIRHVEQREVTQIEKNQGIKVDYSVAALRPRVEDLCGEAIVKTWCATHNARPERDWRVTWNYMVDRKRKQLTAARMDDSKAAAINTLYAHYLNDISMYPVKRPAAGGSQ